MPTWVAADPVVQKYRVLLGDLPWAAFPERPTARPWPGPQPDRRAPFAAAFLVKLHEGKRYMSELRTFLLEHPALVYWLGFDRVPDPTAPYGFDVAQTVPKRRHFSTVLRSLPNTALQFLLDASVQVLRATLPPDQRGLFGDVIAGDTQALLAWVKENNPKQFIKEGRLDKTRQPKGDPDCKLGVKSRPNRAPADADGDDPPAPTTDAHPANRLPGWCGHLLGLRQRHRGHALARRDRSGAGRTDPSVQRKRPELLPSADATGRAAAGAQTALWRLGCGV
ncbi:MAG: hypothetical protein IPO81_00485 [Kouleothrix sp.]|nr:hypothetical protein [Kouleothrix sp.]